MPTVVNVADLMLTSLEYADFYTLGSQDFMFRLEDLQDWTVNGAQTINTINGRRGIPLAAIKSAKGVTGSMTNGVLSLGALRADVGGTIAKNQTETIRWTDVVKVTTAGTVTLNYTPAGTPANIYLVAKQDSNGVTGTPYTLTSENTPASGEYKISGKVITIAAADAPIDSIFVVKYDRSMSGAQVLTNPGDTFSDDACMIATFIGEDKACNQYLVQARFPKVALNGDMSWGAGDDAKTYDLNWTAFASRCSGTGNKFYDVIIVSEDDAEAEEA
ncbi:MAG: hypothetical protein IJG15_03965 [Lachnospiraceae bacterium]|nr:hypothetical protein [Lachnospiraceae bacterium]